jgi:hypothetical protein
MSKDIGYNKYCGIDTNNKTANCADKYNNIQTTCKPAKVFAAEDSQHFKSGSKAPPSSSYTDVMASGVRDPTIDYNYFRAGRTPK